MPCLWINKIALWYGFSVYQYCPGAKLLCWQAGNWDKFVCFPVLISDENCFFFNASGSCQKPFDVCCPWRSWSSQRTNQGIVGEEPTTWVWEWYIKSRCYSRNSCQTPIGPTLGLCVLSTLCMLINVDTVLSDIMVDSHCFWRFLHNLLKVLVQWQWAEHSFVTNILGKGCFWCHQLHYCACQCSWPRYAGFALIIFFHDIVF